MKKLMIGTTGCLLGLIAFWQIPVRGAADEPWFLASTDPSAAVLYVGISSPTTGRVQSMTVYGDGRVELRRMRITRLEESFDLEIEPSEIDRLLRIAVDHRLPEWDDTSIEARLARRLGEKHRIASDAASIHVIVALTSYERGDRRYEDLRKEMRFRAVQSASELAPDVRELEGLKLLYHELMKLRDQAESAGE